MSNTIERITQLGMPHTTKSGETYRRMYSHNFHRITRDGEHVASIPLCDQQEEMIVEAVNSDIAKRATSFRQVS
jgi:hypothetical protein